ncbi:MAG: alpha-mannosidase [Oligosphaeraceae bacterium]
MTENQFKEVLSRLNVFYSRSEEDMFQEYAPLEATIAVSQEPVPWKERESLEYRPLQEGECWGKDWDSCWVHVRGTVPQGWEGQTLVMRLNLGGEALLFDGEGVPVCGMTDHSLFDHFFVKDTYFFPQPAKGGQTVDFWIEGVASNIQGKTNFPWAPHVTRETHPEGQSHPVVKHLRLAIFREELYRFRMEFHQLHNLLKVYHKGEVTRYRPRQIAMGLSRALDVYCGDPENAAAARKALQPLLRLPACASALRCTAIGHAHIDVGWLWPVRESVRKAARTFSSQLRLMEQFPEYHFGASQPQLYQFVKDHYPRLYAQIKERVREGRWECQGGMWVEADNNLPSGESLIRQFLHGKNFFRDEFGVEVRNLWLPDVFGYNGNTPQIMKICGCDTFLTQKLSWNAVNKPEHNTLRWQGIDGTQVLTHFPPEDNYNSAQEAGFMAQAQDNDKDSALCPEFLSLFGIGDGGGGPCRDHVERCLMMKDMEDVPRITMGRAQDALDRMRKYWDDLPVWQGEFYFEKHRATLTSQARTKRGNRLLEQRLAQTEALAALLPPAEYPRKELDQIWKTLLLNQFHDIIPGSSIRLVYQRTQKEHQECLDKLAELQKSLAAKLLAPGEDSLTFFNSLSVPYARPVELPASWATGKVVDAQGDAVTLQVESDGRVFAAVKVPPYAFLTLRRVPGEPSQAVRTTRDESLVLENGKLNARFAPDGTLESLFLQDGNGEECMAAPGNTLSLYHDDPAEYDAWDLDPWYRNQKTANAAAVPGKAAWRERGPVRSLLHFSLGIGVSALEQEVSLAGEGRTLEFHTVVDWKEGRKILRVAFPTTVRSAWATYDIQYGQMRRPTHTNTSWDSVQFEVCAHRYADLSQAERGVALLNDGKYGHCIRDGVLELSLLRSPKWPDYTCDLGRQEFTYALQPHEGPLEDSLVQQEAAQLNRAPACFAGEAPAGLGLPFSLEGKGFTLEVVKRGEKTDDLYLRLVENHGRRARGRLVFPAGSPAPRVAVSDALEWNEEGALPVQAGGCPFSLEPYQILTLKLSGLR